MPNRAIEIHDSVLTGVVTLPSLVGVQFQPPCCTPAGQLVPRPERNLGPFCSFATLGGRAYCLPAANWRTLLGVPKEPKREFHVGDKSGVNLNRGKIEDAVVRAVTGLT